MPSAADGGRAVGPGRAVELGPAVGLGPAVEPGPAVELGPAVVTGGNRGIGLACARALAADGREVAVLSRSGEAPAGLHGVACDVRYASDVDTAFDKVEAELGPAQVVVSNAGIVADTLLARMDEDVFADVLDVNLAGAYRVARRAVRPMLRARWGRLVFMGSVVGLSGSAGQANYAAAKAGLVGLARSLARELAPRGITANVVAPGFVRTDMTAALAETQRAAAVAATPLRRVAEPAEVAAAVAFLASPAAGYITGAVLPVDGGLGMGH